MRKDTKESFIVKARLVHGDSYGYDDVVYGKDNHETVQITCKIHGNFTQTPYSHKNGSGCPYCYNESKCDTKEDFIRKATLVHGGKYDYSFVEYTGNGIKVDIVCPVHGKFKQTPASHKNGNGCRKCATSMVADNKRETREGFITKAREVHGDLYIYDGVVYNGDKEIVQITCKIHGNFTQTPNSHKAGCGCPDCANYGFDKAKPAILYYLSINNGEAYKIGITNRTVKERFSNAELSKIKILQEIKYTNGADAYDAEQKILNDFKEFKYTGHDLLSSGNTELFNRDVLKLYIKG